MSKKIIGIFIFMSLALTGCIGDDFIDDRVEERLSFENLVSEIQVNSTYQFEVTFFNNVGQSETVDVSWSSSNPLVATISSSGLLTAIAEGETMITASITLGDGSILTQETTVTITTEPVTTPDPITKNGVIVTTSSYTLTGDFTISEIASSDDLDLQIANNYQASSNLPGLYLYLSNNPNSISGALELGAVQVFNGAHSYEITNTGINEYKYLLYWCKPFSVKVGHGEILD